MNCGDFRYLVQRRFDVELSPQDDRALLIHLETCDSCQKFYHQVQQVIIAAEELDLSEDLLPQKPEDLLTRIVENLPQEKTSIKEIILSFFAHLGVFPKAGGHGTGILRQNPLVRNSASKQRGAQQSVGVPASWGEPSDAFSNMTDESVAAAQADQVNTRSLGEKFGISGATNVLNNKPGLSLAESIKQKISEMSKSNRGYESISPNAESDRDPLDEWPVPHSPQWPKLNADADAEQWPNEFPGTRAPHTWGSAITNWGHQAKPTPTDDIPDFAANNQADIGINKIQPQDYDLEEPAAQFEPAVNKTAEYTPEPVLNKQSTWSNEAEQLETGAWQTVQLDTTLGATGYPPSAPLSPPLAPNKSFPQSLASSLLRSHNSTPSQLGSSPNSVPPSASKSTETPAPVDINAQELDAQTPSPQSSLSNPTAPASDLQPDFPLENFPQLFMNEGGTASSKPVKKSLTGNEIPSSPLASANSLPTTNVAGVPRISPVVSKRQSDSNVGAAPALPTETPSATPPVPKPSNVRIPALTLPQLGLPENPIPLNSTAGSQSVPPISSPASSRVSSQVGSLPLPVIPAATPPVIPATAHPETPASVPPAVAPALTPSAEDGESRLFNFDDRAIDYIFSTNLGVHERVVPAQVPEPKPAPVEEPVHPPSISAVNNEFETSVEANQPAIPTIDQTAAPSSTQPIAGGAEANNLFTVDDNLIDRIFSDALGVPEHISKNVVGKPMHESTSIIQEAYVQEVFVKEEIATSQEFAPEPEPAIESVSSQPAVNEAADLTPPVTVTPDSPADTGPSLGTALGHSSGKQKLAGVGKLDNRKEAGGDLSPGRIASIGKFLLDNKDLEKIGKITTSALADSKMRTLTIEANEELKNLLNQIDAQEGVTGTVIVGHDGLLIANTIPVEMDPESLGVWALGVFMGTAHVVEKLGDDNVRQIVSQTTQGYLIIANFGAGLLVTLTNPIMLDKLLPLMRTITQLVAA